jgi:hypothetical protein
MRRTILLALLAALAVAPAAHAAGPEDILRDCVEDGVLQGNYSVSELRAAQRGMPADVDEYSDCRDVLSRAIADKTGKGGGGAGGGNGGGSPANPGTGGSGDPGAPPDVASGAPGSGAVPDVDAPVEARPSTQDDWHTLGTATHYGDAPVDLSGRDVSPLLAAELGRNRLPGQLVGVLALVGAAALAWAIAIVRRRRGAALE